MKHLSYLLAVVGVLLAALLVSYFGFDNVVSAVSRVGWWQFGIICFWQIVIFVILGLAWDVVTPGHPPGRTRVMVWGRMVRDAAANCLPFSQIGGFVFGASQILFAVVIVQCIRGGKQATAEVWEGTHPTGLEWTLPSPAPYHSFTTAPEIP